MTAGNTAEAGRQAQIEGFLREVRDALPKNVILSLELPAETILAGTNSDAGQKLSALAPLVDRIYAETTEAEASALETAVKAASAACGISPAGSRRAMACPRRPSKACGTRAPR